MNIFIRLFFFGILLGSGSYLQAQELREYLGDESVLYAETKQINQFFRRINGEETTKGDRIYRGDPMFRSAQLRKLYIEMLFDRSNATMIDSVKRAFSTEVVERPLFLDFHGGEWLAEVSCTFRYQGIQQPITLFLKLEQAEVGSKWVFENVHFAPYKEMFASPAAPESEMVFLHPLSHELDFMNLNKVFRQPAKADRFASHEFRPDFLTLFLFDLKRGVFDFQSVDKVRFHFYQFDGWYFQLNDIQRPGPNRGWLITQLVRVPQGQEDRLLQFIYRN